MTVKPSRKKQERLATRAQVAKHISEYFFPISPRTIERVPIPYIRLGNRSLYTLKDAEAWAQARIDKAARCRPTP